MPSLASVLRAMGRGATRIPGIIGRPFYDTETMGVEETLPSVDLEDPGFFPMSKEMKELLPPWMRRHVRAREAGRAAVSKGKASTGRTPTGIHRVVGQRKRPSGLTRRLREALPAMVQSALAGAATPNVAYGGPTDIIRSLMVGQQFPEELAGRRQARDLSRRKTEAGIEATRAEAEERRASAADRRATAEQRREAAGRPKLIAVGGAIYRVDPQTGEGEWLTPPVGKKPLSTDQFKANILEELSNPAIEPERKKQLEDIWKKYVDPPDSLGLYVAKDVDDKGNVTISLISKDPSVPDDQRLIKQIPLGPIGKPRAADKPSEATVGQIASATRNRNNRMAAAKARAADNLKKAQEQRYPRPTPETIAAAQQKINEQLTTELRQIEADYQEELRILGGASGAPAVQVGSVKQKDYMGKKFPGMKVIQ